MLMGADHLIALAVVASGTARVRREVRYKGSWESENFVVFSGVSFSVVREFLIIQAVGPGLNAPGFLGTSPALGGRQIP